MTEACHFILQPLKRTGGYKIQVHVYSTPRMRTISLCERGSPYANILAIPIPMHTGIPVCIRQSLYE